MTRYIGPIFYSLFLWLVVAAAAWPIFCAVSLAVGSFTGEGWVLDAQNLEPKRYIIAHFLEGYKKSILFSVALGFIAVVDYWLLFRTRILWIISGIAIPVALALGVFTVYKDPMPLLPTFLITGFALLILYRILGLMGRAFP